MNIHFQILVNFGYIFRKTKLSHNKVQMGIWRLKLRHEFINSNLVLLALTQH